MVITMLSVIMPTFVLSLGDEAHHMLGVIMSNGILSSVMAALGAEEYYSADFCVVLGR
jgi:hypothetical protein